MCLQHLWAHQQLRMCACVSVAGAWVRGGSRCLYAVARADVHAALGGRTSSCACAHACQSRVLACVAAAGVYVLRVALAYACMQRLVGASAAAHVRMRLQLRGCAFAQVHGGSRCLFVVTLAYVLAALVGASAVAHVRTRVSCGCVGAWWQRVSVCWVWPLRVTACVLLSATCMQCALGGCSSRSVVGVCPCAVLRGVAVAARFR
jgi:hypothetical protein